METGQKTIQTTNSLNSQIPNKLSIQISLSGLSFCVLNSQSNVIEHFQQIDFDKKLTPQVLLDRLSTIFDTNSTYSGQFETVLLIYHNQLSSIVPKLLFNEQNSADYLKFNAKILKTDYITHDQIEINDSVNVYVPLVNINNYIFDKFGAFEFKHASTILIETLLKTELSAKESRFYINVEKNHLEIILIENGALIFYNAFEYDSVEDFIYYILFTLEQLHLDQEHLKVVLTGSIHKNDANYKILYKYIRHIEFIQPIKTFKYASNIEPFSNYNHFIILNSF
ncbi:hypothetical protein A9Q87_08220 [Flavobacteriales bacterium 34_180_T64]|nr:hypothetical protein A9Q87_08220 [Flavobacteriales bacterium 34_180_T64]